MSVPFKSSPVEFNQHLLFPTNIFDLLPKGHECFLYAELFQMIDTSSLESLYSVKGQNAYHPQLIVAILIFAYSQGVFSSRKIEKRCKEDLSFMFIAQMNCPNFRVLSDFRKDHGDFFQDCFKQTVKLAMDLKLASLGHISLDGSKFKADTSKHKAMSYGRLQEKEQALSAEIADLIEKANRCDQDEDKAYQDKTGYEIPEDLKFKNGRLAKIKAAKQALEQREQQLNPGKAIENKKQISFADTDARIMGKKGSFDYAYNAQISVDADLQIIVAQDISQNANDKQELEPALKALQDTAGRLPDCLTTSAPTMATSLAIIYRHWSKALPMLTLPLIKVKRPTKYRWIARIANWSKPTSTTTKPITRLPVLMAAWGFKYKTGGPWVKRSKNGNPAFGTGYVLRSAAECFLIGTHGSPKIKNHSTRNLLLTGEWPEKIVTDQSHHMACRI
jgi:transposase